MADNSADPDLDEGGEAEPENSPPANNVLLAGIIMSLGSTLLRRAVESQLLEPAPHDEEEASTTPLADSAITKTATRIAAASVPAAALVGSVIVAKSLYARGKARRLARRHAATRQSHGSDT